MATFITHARLALAAALLALPVSATAQGADFDYTVGDAAYRGYVATPKDASRGTVLIVHDWDGLNAYEKNRADMLAAEGYTAFAVDLYGTAENPQGVEDYRRLTGALYRDRDAFRARLAGAYEAAKGLTAGAAPVIMGYCFGGAAVLEAARAAMPFEGFVSFHGGLGTPDGQSYADTKGSVLILHGSADPVSGMVELGSLIDQLQTAGVPHNAEIYGGARHSFTVTGSRDYDPTADAKSWSALLQDLSDTL